METEGDELADTGSQTTAHPQGTRLSLPHPPPLLILLLFTSIFTSIGMWKSLLEVVNEWKWDHLEKECFHWNPLRGNYLERNNYFARHHYYWSH